MGIDEILNSILKQSKIANIIDEKRQNDNEKEYTSQPIIRTAATIKKYELNQTYKKMRDIAKQTITDIYCDNIAKIFYEQGKFMENYQDDYEFHGHFERYFPTYQSMNDHQLRGYFSWRTSYRKGKKANCPPSFVFLFLYELINQIGTENPLDGYEKIIKIYEDYKDEIQTLSGYITIWIKDYVAYYNLEPNLAKKFINSASNQNINVLLEIASNTQAAVFDAITQISSYKLTNSKFYNQNAADMQMVIYDVLLQLSMADEKYNNPFIKQYLGRYVKTAYTIFNTAVFYEKDVIEDYFYSFDKVFTLSCKNNCWQCDRFICDKSKTKRINDLLKAIDYFMREKYGFKSTLKMPQLNDETILIITNTIDALIKEKQEKLKPRINIDIAKLEDIRIAAINTQNKLIVEEDDNYSVQDESLILNKENPAEKIIYFNSLTQKLPDKEDRNFENFTLNDINSSNPIDNIQLLNPIEKQFLSLLLKGQSTKDFLRENNLMESVIIDTINTALYDEFADMVLDFDGTKPYIIQDYFEDIKKYIN